MRVKSIELLIKEEPRIQYFVNIIKERSTNISLDIKCIEYLSINHTAKQICDFLPRYISIAGWSEKSNGLQDEHFKKYEFFNCGDFK